MMDGSDLERVPRLPASFVPVMYDGVASDFVGLVLVRNFGEAGGMMLPGLPVWILETAFVDDARERYEWMLTRPERWAVWARMAPIVGPETLTLMMDGEWARDVRREAELQALADRLARDARTIMAHPTELLGRPCVILSRGDEEEPFLVITFDECIERDRLWDWVRWQTHRYRRWRVLRDEQGAAALKRLIVQSMLHEEHRVKVAGAALGGRRPLRLWRGGRGSGRKPDDRSTE